MGIYDREYMADSRKGTGFRAWSIVLWLLIINGAVYVIQHGVFNNRIVGDLVLGKDTLFSGQVWRLLTFQFCHSEIAHLLSNMLGLFLLGRVFEQIVGSKWVLPVYLLGGLIGGLANVVWEMGFGGGPVIGASASVIAIITALVVSIPEQQVSLLFLPIQFKIKYLGWGLLAFNVLCLFSTTIGISYISHLGGMAAGWIFIKGLLPVLKERENRPLDSGPKKRSKIAEAAEGEIKKKRQKETIYLNKKVDTILEKISEEGMQSLTPDEKKVLERSSKKLSRKLDDK